MRYRKMGETELEVSEVGFGVWTLAAAPWRPPPEEEAVALLRLAYAAGITYYEAGPYGDGRGETLLGRAFSENREMVILATKIGSADGRWDAGALRTSLESSLRRLGTSFVDLLFLQNPPMAALKDDAVFAALDAFRDEGLVRYHGISLGPAVGHYEEGMYAIKKRFTACVGHSFSVLEQDPGRLIFTASLEGNSGNVLRGIHGSGPLAGSYDASLAFTDPEAPGARPAAFLAYAEAAAKNLAWIHEGRGLTLGQAAIKFCLAEETVHTVLPDIRNAAQLAEYSEAPDKDDYSQQDIGEIAEQYRKQFGAVKPG